MRKRISVGVMLLMSGLSAWAAQELHKPIPPIAPTDKAECHALFEAWQPVIRKLEAVAWECERRNAFKEWVRDGDVHAPRQCLALAHQSVNAGRESRSQVEACWAQLDNYKKREQDREREQADQAAAAKKAEEERQQRVKQMQREYEQMQNSFAESERQRVDATRRAVEEQQRAAAEAERQRHDASQRAVNDAVRDMFTSRDRAQEYNSKASSVGNPRNVPLTSRDAQSLDSMRSQAEANNLRPRYVPAEPSGYTATSTAALSGAVANLLGAEAQTIIKWGLNQTEAGSYMVQMFETAGDYDAKYQSFVKSVDYVQKAWNGTTTYEENVGAVGGTLSVLGGFAFRGTPGISIQLDRVFSSVSGIHAVELDRLELLIASLDRPLTSEEKARLSDARAVHALYAPFIPLDRIHRLEAVANEGGRVYDAYNRGFFIRMGR
jgi:hypothetical protein